jgi:hypothetical protein
MATTAIRGHARHQAALPRFERGIYGVVDRFS